MIALGLIIVVVMGVVLGAWWWSASAGADKGTSILDSRSVEGDRPDAPARSRAAGSESHLAVDDLLERWTAATLLSTEQSAAIRRFELDRAGAVAPAAAPTAARRIPAIAEALGYLGGVLAIVGLTLLVGHYWPSMTTLWKLVLSGGVAVALGLVGWAVPEAKDAALARLRSFVWLASTAAGGLFAGVLAYDGWGITRAQSIALSVSIAVAAIGAVTWQLRDRVLQQVVTLVALEVVAGTATNQIASLGYVGIVVGALGALLIASAWWRRMSLTWLNVAVGSVAVLVSGLLMRTDWMAAGLLYSLATSVVMLAAVLAPPVHLARPRRLIIGIVGLVTLSQGVPQSIVYFADRAGVMTGLVVWVVGAILMILATRHEIRSAGMVEVAGGVSLIGGAAICATQSSGFSSIFGLLTALALLALGTRPGQVMLSFLGSVGLLVFVPWSIVHFFPGPGRAPLMILISGALILSLALMLSRQRGRIPQEFAALFDHRWPGRHGRVTH